MAYPETYFSRAAASSMNKDVKAYLKQDIDNVLNNFKKINNDRAKYPERFNKKVGK